MRGAGPLRQRARRGSPVVLLAGDASGYVDALTGEGIALGLAHARAAVAAVRAGEPRRYEREWRRLGWRHELLTHGLPAATRHRASAPASSPPRPSCRASSRPRSTSSRGRHEPGPPEELVVLLDEQGEAIGTTPKRGVHHADTPLHLAFSCYLFDDTGRLLMTRRALHKPTWPGAWTNSVCGHPAPGEPIEDAVRRRVLDEVGVRA